MTMGEPMDTSDATGPPYESILSIESGDEAFDYKLAKAFRILNESPSSIDILPEGSDPARIDPRFEFLLRWLLKYFKQDGDESSACLNQDAWALFQLALARTFPARVARVLATNGFAQIIQKVYKHLRSEVASNLSSLNGNAKPKETDGRPDLDIIDVEPKILSLGELFVGVFSCQLRVQQILQHQQSHNAIVAEQLKHAVVNTLAGAAATLGNCLYLLCQVYCVGGHGTRTSPKVAEGASRLGAHLDLAVKFWSLQSTQHDGSIQKTKYREFTRDCLFPSLLLLKSIKSEGLENADISSIRTLEGLIRNNFPGLSQKNLDLQDAKRAEDHLLSYLQDDLCDSLIARAEIPRSQSQKRFTCGTLLSHMFDLISTSQVHNSRPKARLAHERYLRRLFTIFKACLDSTREAQDQTVAHKDHSYWDELELLLEQAARAQIELSAEVLDPVLDELIVLNSDNEPSFGLKAIGLCLQTNSDKFVVPVRGAQNAENAHRSANTYLTVLFSKLSRLFWEGSKSESELEEMTSSIATCLLKTFCDARDLAGWLEHAREQLNETYKLRPSLDLDTDAILPVLKHQNVWDSRILFAKSADLIETNLSIGQVESQISNIQARLENHVGPGDLEVLDCLLCGCQSEDRIAKIAPLAKAVFLEISGACLAGASAISEDQRWRLWRILTVMNLKWALLGSIEPWIEMVYRAAAQGIELFEKQMDSAAVCTASDSLECSYIFGYLVSLLHLSPWLDRSNTSVSLEDILNQCMQSLMMKAARMNEAEKSLSIAGKGSPLTESEDPKSASPLGNVAPLHASCVQQLLQTSGALRFLRREVQLAFFEHLFQLSIHAPYTVFSVKKAVLSDVTSGLYHHQYWRQMLRCEDLSTDKHVQKTFRQFKLRKYLECLDEEDPPSWGLSGMNYRLAFALLRTENVSNLGREQRASIANKILDIMLYTSALDEQQFLEHTQLLLECMKTPNSLMNIFRKMDYVHDIPKLVGFSIYVPPIFALAHEGVSYASSAREKRSNVGKWLCEVARQVLEQISSDLVNGANSTYFISIYQFLDSVLKVLGTQKLRDMQDFLTSPQMLLLATACLEFYNEKQAVIKKYLSNEIFSMDDLRQRHLDTVIRDFEKSSVDFATNRGVDQRDADSKRLMILHCLCNYADILACHPSLDRVRGKLQQIVAKESDTTTADDNNQKTRVHLLSNLDKLELKLSLVDQQQRPDSTQRFHGLAKAASIRNEEVLPEFQEDLIAMLDDSQFVDFLQSTAFQKIIASKKLNPVLTMRSTLYRLEGAQTISIGDVISEGVPRMLENMQDQSDVRLQLLSMQCISLILQPAPRVVNQYHIDSALSAIANCASQIATSPNDADQIHIYDGLCRVFANILTSHRPKIGGRSHLVIPVLQSLLQCLFSAYQSTASIKGPNDVTESINLGQRQAKAYARILTTLCDPSPSAVTRSKRRNKEQLNDATRRAKIVVGQYMQYLIMTYCECQLTGRLPTAGMKEALEPGLWAALGCMSPDVIRTMNSALSKSGRVIWQRLYSEWKQFGQWKGG